MNMNLNFGSRVKTFREGIPLRELGLSYNLKSRSSLKEEDVISYFCCSARGGQDQQTPYSDYHHQIWFNYRLISEQRGVFEFKSGQRQQRQCKSQTQGSY